MFVQVSPESVTVAGETIGITNLPGNVTRALAEDVSYRTREVASLASLFLRHSRKRKLTVDDMNLALKWSDVEQVVGQGGGREVAVSQLYTHIPELDMFVDTDTELDMVDTSLADTKPMVDQETRLNVTASWLHVEGGGDTQQLTPHLQQYYNAVVTCVLGDSESLCSKMLRDVASNGKISPLLTYLITFARHIMKRFQNKTKLITRMLRLISAIFSNPHLNLSPKPYLSHLVTALLETVLCSNMAAADHVVFASTILSLALTRWATPVNQLQCQTLNHLRDVVHHDRSQVPGHGLKQVGALTCLTLLGPSLLCDSLHPWPAQLWSLLDNVACVNTNVSVLQWAAVRSAAAGIFNFWLSDTSDHCTPNWSFYADMYQYFGDSLVPHLKPITKGHIKPKKTPIKLPETYGRMRLRKIKSICGGKPKPDVRQAAAENSDRSDMEPILTASQNFEFLADMGVPSDIFDEPVMDFDNLGDSRPNYVQQQSVTSTHSNNSYNRHFNISRSVRETFPDITPVRRNRNISIQLPLIPSNHRPGKGTSDTSKYNCVTWRHLVTGGRVGTKYRRAEGNKINKICSYIDIMTGAL